MRATWSATARAVPPVASTSSSTRYERPGVTAPSRTSIVPDPYSHVYPNLSVAPGSLPGFLTMMSPRRRRLAMGAPTTNPRDSTARTASKSTATSCNRSHSPSHVAANRSPSAKSGARSLKSIPGTGKSGWLGIRFLYAVWTPSSMRGADCIRQFSGGLDARSQESNCEGRAVASRADPDGPVARRVVPARRARGHGRPEVRTQRRLRGRDRIHRPHDRLADRGPRPLVVGREVAHAAVPAGRRAHLVRDRGQLLAQADGRQGVQIGVVQQRPALARAPLPGRAGGGGGGPGRAPPRPADPPPAGGGGRPPPRGSRRDSRPGRPP